MKATHDQQAAYYRVIVEIVRGCEFESFLELGIGGGQLAGILREGCPALTQITGVDVHDGHPPPDGVEWIRNKPTDQFFAEDERRWDCIFVDADHMRPQATRDVVNSMKRLADDGLLFMHDTYPPSPESINPMACGDVYRTYLALAGRSDVEVVNLPLFNGLAIIRRVDERRLWTIEEN